jgi:hypothetical protein
MSILTTEYAIHYLDSDGKVIWKRGPYASVEMAKQTMQGSESYVIMERAVTKWDPAFVHQPKENNETHQGAIQTFGAGSC